MRKLLSVTLLFFALFFFAVSAQADPPKVVCVPFDANVITVPHDTWSGLEVTVKGTAHDPDGDATLATYEWNFGDGSPVETGAVTNPYVIEARHTYTGNIGDMFVATLKVTDTSAETGTDQYLVEIKDSSDLAVRVNVAIDEGLWRLHKDQVRGTLPDGTPYGYWPYPYETTTWTRVSGTAGDITGAWQRTSESGNLYDLTLGSDGSWNVVGQIVVDCPGTYTASGTYTYDSGTGILTVNTTSSNFVCHGPEVGTKQFTALSIESTTMTWLKDEEDWTVSATGASTEAFEIQGTLPNGDPDEDPYVETVQRGLNYLLSQMYSFPVAQDSTYCPQGDPDVNGNGIGLCCYTDQWHSMYESGIALMALASSGCPSCVAATGIPEVVGQTYLDIAQDMVDYFAYAQSDPYTGVYEGGWRYYGNIGESDNSVSQWPVIGMEAGEVNFGHEGLLVPQFVKDELNLWIDYIQNDLSGGSGYMHPDDWVNIAKTGGLLCEMKFVGDTTASGRVEDASEFIYNNWDTDWEHFPANSYYAFYSVMKGFRLLCIETIPINDPSGFDWYGDQVRGYAPYIVADQDPNGAWQGGAYSGHPLTSAWAILTLKKTVVQPGPVADAGPDVPNHPPLIEITFDGTGSYHRDPDRSIVKYEWDFGDGSPPVEGPIVTHAYPAVFNPDDTIDWDATTADYTVTLTVVDDSSPALTDLDTCVVHITPPPWPPVADANGPYTVYQCETLTLDGSGSYDPNGALYPDPSHPWHGEIVSWEWDLDNDGEYDDAAGETTTWSSCDLGLYVVGLKVTNNFGESDEVDTVINVTSNIPNQWTINKGADQSDLVLSIGQTFMVNYEVTLDETATGSGIDECVNVFDSLNGFLGTVCDDATLPYGKRIGPYNSCGTYTVENTATFVANDTRNSGSDSWTVNVDVPCEVGCTLSHGYWKTHSSYGPAPYDDTWALIGEDTMFFLSGQTYYGVLWTAAVGGHAYYIAAHQHIAARLNVLNGASIPDDVLTAWNEATGLFEIYTPDEVLGLKGKAGREVRMQFLGLAEILDDYNNGITGPGHCSE